MFDHQNDEEMILIDEAFDEALGAAAFTALGGFPTLIYGPYCFACPSDPTKLLSRDEATLVSCLSYLETFDPVDYRPSAANQ